MLRDVCGGIGCCSRRATRVADSLGEPLVPPAEEGGSHRTREASGHGDQNVPPAQDAGYEFVRTRSKEEFWAHAGRAWDEMHAAEDKVFFQTLTIAKDGGLDEIGVKEELWYSTRPVSAAVLLLFVVYNVYFLLFQDLSILYDALFGKLHAGRNINQDFLLTKAILDSLHIGISVTHATAWLAVAELSMLTVVIFYTAYHALVAFFGRGFARWWSVSNLCWECLPQLSNFSAMKVLAYISPPKLSVDLFDILFYRESGVARGLVMFFITRPLCIVFGVDCFLIKFRIAARSVLATEATKTHFLGSFIFLNQILGALNLARELRFRLYRFVFGGEDGIVTDAERNIQHVWEAMITEKMFLSYPLWKAMSIMLTWCDDDFQLLTLNQENFKMGAQ